MTDRRSFDHDHDRDRRSFFRDCKVIAIFDDRDLAIFNLDKTENNSVQYYE